MDEMAEHRGWLIRRGDYQASPRVSYVKRYSALAARSLISSHPSYPPTPVWPWRLMELRRSPPPLAVSYFHHINSAHKEAIILFIIIWRTREQK